MLWGNISALSFLHFRRFRFGTRTQTPLIVLTNTSFKRFLKIQNFNLADKKTEILQMTYSGNLNNKHLNIKNIWIINFYDYTRHLCSEIVCECDLFLQGFCLNFTLSKILVVLELWILHSQGLKMRCKVILPRNLFCPKTIFKVLLRP